MRKITSLFLMLILAARASITTISNLDLLKDLAEVVDVIAMFKASNE